jgi:predicted metal-dependent HD superfamily phosphohydrolase
VVRCYDSVPHWQHPDEVYLAILFHDAIYVAGAKDNEARSAELAREAIARYALAVDVARVEELILLTARHGTLSPSDVDEEAALFLDCDMAILGSDSFARYDAQIAEEYSAIPRELYLAGRRRFLEKLLTVERIYLSDHFHALLDARARENLRDALK